MKFGDSQNGVHGYQNCLDMIKYFGRYLENVSIRFGYTTDSSTIEDINRSLNRYCSESLKSLQMNYQSKVFNFEGFTKPFDDVEEFSAEISKYEQNASRPLNEVFPNLRRLDLRLSTDENITFIDGKFPHLDQVHLKVDIYSAKKMKLIEPLEGTIKKSPTIQCMEFNFFYPDNFLQFLSEALPNLERLKMNHLRIAENDTLRFENLKQLILNSPSADIKNLEKLSLPHLESFETFYTSSRENELKHFLRRHNGLKRLYLTDFPNLLNNAEYLNVFLTVSPNLVELKIKLNSYNGIEQVDQFIRSHEQFEKVDFEYASWTVSEADVQALKEQLQSEWTVEGVRGNYRRIQAISIERKIKFQSKFTG